MDKAAAAFGIDPIDIRRRNLVRTFPYTSATGLVFDEASYLETMEAAVAAIGVPAFRARQANARAQGLSRAWPCDVFRAHRLWHARLRRPRHGRDAGLGNRRDHDGSVRLRRGAHRRVPARRPAAPRCRRSSPTSSARRPTASRSCTATPTTPYGWGAFPVSLVIAGRRHLAGGGQAARQAREDGRHPARGVGRRHRARSRRRARRRHRPRRSVRHAGARGLSSDPPVQGRGRAGARRDRDLRSARNVLQRLPRRDGGGGCRDRPRHDREIPGGRGCRAPDQSHDRRRADSRRRAQGIANALLEEIIYDETGNILTASLADYLPDRARDSADRDPSSRDMDASLGHWAKGLAKAARSARRSRWSTPSTMRWRRSARRSTSSRRRRSASARRCAGHVPEKGPADKACKRI